MSIKDYKSILSKFSTLPKDVRFVVVLAMISAFMQLLGCVLLVTGIAHVPEKQEQKAHIILSHSEVVDSIYALLMCCACLVTAYGLCCLSKFGWRFSLFFSVYNIISGFNFYPQYPVTFFIGIVWTLGIIAWLLWRRGLFGVSFLLKEKGDAKGPPL